MDRRRLYSQACPSVRLSLMNKVIATVGMFLGVSLSAHAEKFGNQFIQFEAPPQWQCLLEGAEWVCQNTLEAKKKDAIIVLAAKIRGDQDNEAAYLAYLKKPKSYQSVQNKPVTSEVKYAQSTAINGHTWVDSLHKDSELPGFYTRYLATTKEDIGVLVTYSINSAKYSDYMKEFEAMANTLRVFRKPGGINVSASNSDLFKQIAIPQNLDPQTVFGENGAQEVKQQPVQKRGMDDSWIYILAGIGVIGFILYRKRMGK